MSPKPLATEEQAVCLYCTQASQLLSQETNPLKQESSEVDQTSRYEGQRLEHISSRAQCLCLHRKESLMSNYPTNKAAYCIVSQAGM